MKTQGMRALRSDGQSLILDARVETPALRPGEALVRPLRVALSGRDADGLRSSPPFTPGSEFVGVVDRLHPDADAETRRRLEGHRVIGSPTIVCGACDQCRSGLSSHCRERRVLGRPGWDGCLAERFRIPARNLVAVPGHVDDDHAVFTWSIAGALHAAQMVRVEGKPFVTVLGDTVKGLLAAQIIARVNPGVRVLGSRPERLTLCEKWLGGIKHRTTTDAGRRADQDVVIDCSETAGGVSLALALVRPRGVVVLAGPPGQADLDAVVENEATLIGARAGSVTEAIALLSRSEVDVVSLIGRRFRLSDGAAALAAAAEPDALKVLVEV